MAVIATPFVPSTTNTKGTALGLIVGAMAVKWLVAAPFVLKLCSVPFLVTVGLTPVGLAGIIGVGVTSIVGYGVTHIAELREADKFAQVIQDIKVEHTYPVDKDAPVGSANNLTVGGK